MKLTKFLQTKKLGTSKRCLIVLVLAVTMLGAVMVAPPQKAYADVPPAWFICAATRPGWVMALEELQLVNPYGMTWYYMDPYGQFVKTSCEARSAHWHCTWYAFLWSNGSYNGQFYTCNHW
jgi:hypothetical protein